MNLIYILNIEYCIFLCIDTITENFGRDLEYPISIISEKKREKDITLICL